MRGDIRLLMTASCLGNPMDKGGWATARGLAESDTTEKTHTHTHTYLMCLSSVGSLLRRGDGAKQQLPGGVQLLSSLLAWGLARAPGHCEAQ